MATLESFSDNTKLRAVVKHILINVEGLCEFLDKYLEFLNLDNAQNSTAVDFVKAATVVQTMSVVHAKKVDILDFEIASLTATLHLVINGSGEQPSAGLSCKKIKKRVDKESALLSFTNMRVADNIRKQCIKRWDNIVERTTTSFDILDSRKNEFFKVKLKDSVLCSIYDEKGDVLCTKEELNIYNPVCNTLIPQYDFCVPCVHSMTSIQSWDQSIADIDNCSITGSPLMNEAPTSPVDNESQKTSFVDLVENFLHDNNDRSIGVEEFRSRFTKLNDDVVDVDGYRKLMRTPVLDGAYLNDITIKGIHLDESNKGRKRNAKNKTEDYDGSTKLVDADLFLAWFKLKCGMLLDKPFMKLLKSQRAALVGNNRKNNLVNADADNEGEHQSEIQSVAVPFEPEREDPEGYFEDEPDINQMPINYEIMEDNDSETVQDIRAQSQAIHAYVEKEGKRPRFDIHEYGTKVLAAFSNDSAKTSLSFEETICKQPKADTARLFQAMLTLANTDNLTIEKGTDDLTINDMTVTMMSRVRHHEMLDEDMRRKMGNN